MIALQLCGKKKISLDVTWYRNKCYVKSRNVNAMSRNTSVSNDINIQLIPNFQWPPLQLMQIAAFNYTGFYTHAVDITHTNSHFADRRLQYSPFLTQTCLDFLCSHSSLIRRR